MERWGRGVSEEGRWRQGVGRWVREEGREREWGGGDKGTGLVLTHTQSSTVKTFHSNGESLQEIRKLVTRSCSLIMAPPTCPSVPILLAAGTRQFSMMTIRVG